MKDAHLRAKAVELRTKHQMTLDQIVERLQLPKTTIYYWIRHIPIERTERQSEARQRASKANEMRAAAKRQAAYDAGLAEAPELLKDPLFRDFVVLYMAEGSKRDRNSVEFVNSDPKLVKLAYRWMKSLSSNKLDFRIQYHADHDVEELKRFWAELLNIEPSSIGVLRKSNSNELSGRQFRSVHGLLTIRASDTYFRSRLGAWMDYVKSQW